MRIRAVQHHESRLPGIHNTDTADAYKLGFNQEWLQLEIHATDEAKLISSHMQVHLNTIHFTVSTKHYRSLNSNPHELILETKHSTTYITAWNCVTVWRHCFTDKHSKHRMAFVHSVYVTNLVSDFDTRQLTRNYHQISNSDEDQHVT